MSSPSLHLTLAALPSTRRGYGLPLSHSNDGKYLLYTNGRLVLIRSIDKPSECRIFSEHKSVVTYAVQSPSGVWIASGDDTGNVIIWDYKTLKIKNTFTILKNVSSLDWDADSQRIIAGGDGALKARVFNAESGNNLGEITMHSQPILSVSYRKVRPFRVVTSSEDLGVNIYEGPPFKYANSHKRHSRYPNAVKYNHSGSHYISVGSDTKIFVYDGSSGDVVREIDANKSHTGAIYDFDWSPDDKRIVTASADKTCRVFDVEKGDCLQTVTCGQNTEDMQMGILWPRSELIISVSLSGQFNYIDPSTGKIIKQIFGHQNSLQCLAVHSGNIYTGAISGEVCEWTPSNDGFEAKWLPSLHSGKSITALAVSEDGVLVSAGLDNRIIFTNLSNLDDVNGVNVGGGPVAISYSAQLNAVAVVTGHSHVLLVKEDRILCDLNVSYVPTTVCFAHDSKKVYVGGKDTSKKQFNLYVYSVDSSHKLQEVKQLDPHIKPITSIACSSDGNLIASADAEASIFIHRIGDNNLYELCNKNGWRFHQAGINDIIFSPSNSQLVTGSLDTNLIIWNDLTNFTPSNRVKISFAHTADVLSVRYLNDNSVVSIGADKLIRIHKL